MDKIESTVQAYIDHHSMLKKGEKVLIALSGGADSVSLLLILHSLGYECHATHCNFHLRAEESMRDERFVTDLCTQMQVPLHKTDFDTESYAKEKGISIEMAARELRYDYFHKLKSEIGANAIAVGHHKDDNVETLLLNLVRGSGIQGLCGIQPTNNDIIRPLLCVSRMEILEYLKSKEQSFVTDSTNLHDDYSRNKIRLNILPELGKINSAVTENIITTISNLNEARKVYNAAIQADIKRCASSRPEKLNQERSITIDFAELKKCVSPSSVLHEIIHPLGFNTSQEADVMEAAHQGKTGTLFFSDTHILTIDRGRIIINIQEKAISSPIPLCEYHSIEVKETDIDHLSIVKDKNHAFIDKAKVHGNLYIRPCKPGDYFIPFGMKGRKLLSDYMTDRKFNRIQKMQQLVLVDQDDNIVWLIGERTSENYKIDIKTSHILVLHKTQ